MRLTGKPTNESGVALIAALLAVMLVSALMAGMFAAIQADQRGSAIDRDQTQAYAAAHAGLEQLTSSLATLFNSNVSPTVAQINAIAAAPPIIPGFAYKAPGGAAGSGYRIDFTDANLDGNPDVIPNADITTGPFTGFKGLITPYTMTVTARSTGGGSEVRLRRGLQTVAVPVFQFGIFSESDLSIFSGGGFNFGGRVHTNGSLFVAAQTSGATNITFNDRITAVNEVVRNFLSNGLNALTSAPSFTNNVLVPTSSSTNLNLRHTPNEGSVLGMPGPGQTPNPNWTTISKGTFKSYIRTGLTGAKKLDLPLVSQGAQPVDLIRRPVLNSNEHLTNPLVYAQRFYSQASLRILLSDRPADFAGLPTITPDAPVLLNGTNDGAAFNWTVAPPAGYGPVGPHPLGGIYPPIARSIGRSDPFGNTTSTMTHNATASIYSGVTGLSQIYVATAGFPSGIPNVYALPTLTVFNGGVPVLHDPDGGGPLPPETVNIRCSGKTGITTVAAAAGPNPLIPANSFIGCNRILASAAVVNVPAVAGPGLTIRALIDNRTAIANVPGNIVGGGNATITVGNDETAPFSPNLIWLNNPNAVVANTAVPITCEGFTQSFGGSSPRFLNCRGLTAAPALNQPISTSALANQNTGTIGGYLKVEKQDAGGNWTDVTMEILNLGFGAPNSGGTICQDPTPNAVIRIQRLRDNGGGPAATACSYQLSQNSWDWWPNALYDAREGSFRDSAAVPGMTTSPMVMGGVMHYISLDVNNLKRWLAGTIGTTGTTALNSNGYIVYFSDRRGNHDSTMGDVETGEYGFEDHVNSTSAAGAPDGVLQLGEDVNIGDLKWPINTQQMYGAIPWNDPVNIPSGATAPYSFAAARPATVIPISNTIAPAPGAGQARVNKALLFRRALKLVNAGIVGGVSSLPDAGLTVVAENPAYVHGNYNAVETAPPADWSNQEPNRPAAIIADSIALLSRNWSDARSFERPHQMLGANGRQALTTSYRFAAIGGKGLSFPYCGAPCGNPGQLFGTDGGAANFLRMLEDWAGTSINYRGSIVSLHINRQAIGTYKFAAANNHIYNAGARNFSFDIDFLTPALLPPGTPMFRDVNTLQFRQILRPNQ